jgi:hypothetical protein
VVIVLSRREKRRGTEISAEREARRDNPRRERKEKLTRVAEIVRRASRVGRAGAHDSLGPTDSTLAVP